MSKKTNLLGSAGFEAKYARPLKVSHSVKSLEDKLEASERENALLRGQVRKLKRWKESITCRNVAGLRALGVVA